MNGMKRRALLALVSILTSAGVRAEEPTKLVASGVDQVAYAGNAYVVARDPGTFWYTQPGCTGSGTAGDETAPALITRGSTQAIPPREILRFNPTRPVGACNPYRLASNIAADAEFLYFIDNQGPGGRWALQKRSRNANTGDPSTLLVDLGTSIDSAEVNAEYPTVLFVILHEPGTPDRIVEFWKSDGGLVDGNVETAGRYALKNLQFDGRYLYWIDGGSLRADDTTNGARKTIASGGVSTYVTEGYNEGQCGPGVCDPSVAWVLYAKGNQVRLTDTVGGGDYVQYTSTESNATIQSITRDIFDVIYVFERRPVPGGGLGRDDRLFRLVNGVPELLYGPVNNNVGFNSLTTDSSYLYFHDRPAKTLLRLPRNAAALPVYDLRATGIEVTQGIQNPQNDVSLIRGRRTFVRFYAKSFGASSVWGVAASLDVFGFDGIFLGSLAPVNGVGQRLRLSTNPKRSRLDDSFLFELPIAWTHQPTLRFLATVNPWGTVREDELDDNWAGSPTFTLLESPRLDLEIVDFRYIYSGRLVTGGFLENFQSFDYMERIYPLAWSGGGIADPGPGLHRNITVVHDDEMGQHVDQTSPNCSSLGKDKNKCAGLRAIALIRAMRSAGELPANRYYYGAIANDGTLPFTRGFNPGGETIGVGPRLDGHQQNYMSHEIGHALGRGHPSTGAKPICGDQTADDEDFPNPNARIGYSISTVTDDAADMGFDPGQRGNPNQPRQLRTSSASGDFMSYCAPYWTSRYNYDAIWTRLTTAPLAARSASAMSPLAAPSDGAMSPGAAAIGGDWLLTFGSFSLTSRAGTFTSVRRLEEVAEVPPLDPGGYALELRDANGGLLARHDFTPTTIDEGSPELRGFGLVVPFVEGTGELRIIDLSRDWVLASRSVSASSPTVSDVELLGAPDPVTGVVDVTWTASDADGDPLRYSVFFSRDGGLSWRALWLSLEDPFVSIDTETLGGGTGMIRVEASDGALSGRAESASFTIAPKPPRPSIQNPAGEIHLEWGQLVSFLATAEDPQEEPLPDESFVWSNPYRTLGTGRSLGVDDLEVGAYDVVLWVTNAAGLTATADVRVVVGDRVAPPGPRPSASPASFSWSVGADATDPATGMLEVLNVGGEGELSLTVESAPDWLRVNGETSLEATAPVDLEVTADPAGLPPGESYEGQIVLTRTSDPTDRITIPVSLVKGLSFVGGPADETPLCGDGVLDSGEDCDEGAANGAPGSCCSTGCVARPDGESCDDGDACTLTDACDGWGTCVGSDPVECAASDACHLAGSCDPATGVCPDPPAPEETPCDDGDACTAPDSCDGQGTCVPGGLVLVTEPGNLDAALRCLTSSVP